jgi:uncharacterized protein involved in exopolysaccharide biosynthesis
MNGLATLDEILSAILRHIVLLAIVVAAGVTASLFYALSLPREYETSAVIQIEQPQIQQEAGAAAGTSNGRTLQQLQIIEQRVMARDNLLNIIAEFDLYGDHPAMSDSDKVVALRESASVTQITDPALRWRPDITPTALNITVRQGSPELAAAVANELVNNVLEENRSSRSERATETLEFFESEEQRVGKAIEELEGEIADFKRENSQSLPEGLVGLRDELTTLHESELEIDRQIVELRTGSGSGSTVVQNRMARLEEQRDLYRERISGIETILRSAPDVERALNGLERNLQKLTDQYLAITRNQAEAEMSLMLQASQQGESFRILERAIEPEDPIAPNRKRIAFLGCVLSGILGLVLVAILELRNPVIRTEAQLQRRLGLRAVAIIPNVQVARERTWRRISWIVGIAALSIGLFLVLVIVT